MVYPSCIAAIGVFNFKKINIRQCILRLIFTCLFIGSISFNANAVEPSVNYFGWQPANVETNQPTYFKWDVRNVQSCTSNVSGLKTAKGSIGPVQWAEPRESTAKWFCTDLDGNRYPASGFLESTLKVSRPKPKIKKFYWSPSITTTGQNSYFYWDIENVTSCTSTVSGSKPSSGVLGPYRFTTPRDSTTRWYCTDLNGDRFPASGYLKARHIVNAPPSPSVKYFRWSPSTVEVGKPTKFEWDIDNVQGCTSINSGSKNSSGSLGPYKFYGEPINATTSWYCTDLSGNRYPRSGYLVAKRTVINPSNIEHIRISYPGSVSGESAYTNERFVAKAQIMNGASVNKIDYSLDGVNWFRAINYQGRYQHDFGYLAEGSYSLWVRVDDIPQPGLKKGFTVSALSSPELVYFGWDVDKSNSSSYRASTNVPVGQATTFSIEIKNVESCTSIHSGLYSANGGSKVSVTRGPYKFYGIATSSTTSWSCIDLVGNTFTQIEHGGKTVSLEAIRHNTNPTNIEHIDISYTGSDTDNIITTKDALVAMAEPLTVKGVHTAVSSVAFRYLKVGTSVILDTVAAVENNNTFTSTFENNLSAGNYVLQVVIDGVAQGGLDKYFTVVEVPELAYFGWDVDKSASSSYRASTNVPVGQATTFSIEIKNVESCTSIHSGLYSANGGSKVSVTRGPYKFYGNATSSTTSWSCIDLTGNTFTQIEHGGKTVSLEAIRHNTNPTNIEHIDISFTNSDIGRVFSTNDNLIANATPLAVNGVMTDISSVSFRYLKFGTSVILETVAAVKSNNTFTSTFENNLAAGNYVLQVVIDGAAQGGLDKYFTVTESNIPMVYQDEQGNLYIKNEHNVAIRYIKLSWVNNKWVVTELFEDSPPDGGWDNFEAALSQSDYVLTIGDFNNDGIEDIKLSNGLNVITLIRNESNAYELPARKIIFIHTDILGTPIAETDTNGDVL